ncbi:hypothetical protein [Caldichromatium japonicum]|uniref:hypothetical protein n=1 Tax=Caldichromatium japonicum TaxID=2699430 RepID=UPI001FE5D5AC|nr:hypothetical protein [Caldichromatium japonicum]
MDNFPHGKRDDGHRQGGEAAWRLGQDLATLGARRGFDPGGANSREAQIRELIGLRSKVSEPMRIDAYCRISSAAQKPDLADQRKVLEEFDVAKGLSNVEFVEEIGGGLNFKRKFAYCGSQVRRHSG